VPRSYLALPALNSSTVARYFLTVLAATICFASLPTLLFAQANVQGSWQTLPNLMPINPVHAALLHNGKVLVVSGSGNVAANTNFQAGIFDPQTGTVTTQSVSWDMFCNGIVVLPDGRAFINSGTLQYDPFHGDLRSAIYDLNTGIFTDIQNMTRGRWYPTVTNLGDGSLMTFSGLSETGSTNTTVEIYSVSTGWSPEIGSPFTPPLYPRMHLLPSGKVFYSGSTTQSRFFDPAAKTWSGVVANTNYSGSRTYGTSVLLPLSPANNYKPVVMIMGGGNPSTATTELIDLSLATLKWTDGPSMSQPRIEMNATILPNGKIIALGGSLNDEDTTTASLNTDLYDPIANTFSSAGANVFARLYHSNSLLLPDATVWFAGGNPARGNYEQHMEIYSPAYLFNPDGTLATRPAITSIPVSGIRYGTTFQVQTPDAASITSVVLIRPGAPTHAFDMEQRLVAMNFTTESGVLNVTAPPNGNIAPPGYYMLFILNSSGVPSVARFVQLAPAPADKPPAGSITSPATDVTITGGQSVYFSGSGYDPDGTIAAYSWSFPGGSPSTSSLATPGNVIYGTAGTFAATLTVTDNAGLADPTPPSRKITVNPAPDFTISARSTSQAVVRGSGSSNTININRVGSFSGAVTLSVSGLPSGASASFNPNPGLGNSSTFAVTTTSTTPTGTFALTITGGSGSLTCTTPVKLVVNAPTLADFSLAVSPGSRITVQRASTSYTVSTTRTGGFSAAVTLSASGLPSGVTATFSPNPASANSSTLTVKTSATSPLRTFILSITGVSGSLRHTATATITITRSNQCDGQCE